jgi:uncharacterized membrane protein YhdT
MFNKIQGLTSKIAIGVSIFFVIAWLICAYQLVIFMKWW